MSDEILVQQIKSGDQKALSTVYETYRTEFLRWIMKDFRCPEDDAKDIFQVSVLIVYENIQKGKLDRLTSKLKTYLFSVGKNLTHEWSRQAQRNLPFEADQYIQKLAMDEPDLGTDDKLDLVYNCLKKLGPPCRELLEQFYFNLKTMDEITATMGYKNADSAKNQKYKCMGRLRKFYEEEFAKQLT